MSVDVARRWSLLVCVDQVAVEVVAHPGDDVGLGVCGPRRTVLNLARQPAPGVELELVDHGRGGGEDNAEAHRPRNPPRAGAHAAGPEDLDRGRGGAWER